MNAGREYVVPDDRSLVNWKKSPAALFRTSTSLPPAKGVTFASCVQVLHTLQVRHPPMIRDVAWGAYGAASASERTGTPLRR